jgi:hypothetical protein
LLVRHSSSLLQLNSSPFKLVFTFVLIMQTSDPCGASFALHSFTESVRPSIDSKSTTRCSVNQSESSQLLPLDSPSPPTPALSSHFSIPASGSNHACNSDPTPNPNLVSYLTSNPVSNVTTEQPTTSVYRQFDPLHSSDTQHFHSRQEAKESNSTQSNQSDRRADHSSIDADMLTSANFYLQFKQRPDDTRSNKSVATSRSTRQIFDLMARLLPAGVLLLVLMLMLHFVLYVRDLEPYKSISEVVCKALAASVIPLSVVFILRIVCDCNRNVYAPDTFDSLQDTTPPPTATHLYAYATEIPPTSASFVGAARGARLMQIRVPVITNPITDPHPTPT